MHRYGFLTLNITRKKIEKSKLNPEEGKKKIKKNGVPDTNMLLQTVKNLD